MSQPRQPQGRPSKGDRHWVNSGIPEEQYEIYAANAELLGVHLGTYFALRMAEAHGLEPAKWVTEEIRLAEKRRLEARRRAAQVPIDQEGPMARAG